MRPKARARVLIADDQPGAAELVAELIRSSLSCEITICHDGVEALTSAAAQRPDVMVLDVRMPGLDGLEVARQVRELYENEVPYLIALTGQPDTARHLAAIEKQFDRAFAKPLDVDQLIDTLARVTTGRGGRGRRLEFELGELFTQAARQVIPQARHLSFSFDYRGPGVVVRGEPADVERGVHRLLLGVVDMLSSGFVTFSADASVDKAGRCTVIVEAAGTGSQRHPDEISAVLRRLRLVEPPGAPLTPSAARAAGGTCPCTGAPVAFSSDPHEGILLRATFDFVHVAQDDNLPAATVVDAQAWLIDIDEVPSAWLLRRLQRQGWFVRRFASCGEALRRALRLQFDGRAPPALLVVVEAPSIPIIEVESLWHLLPGSTRCVFAVMAGDERLGTLEAPSGYELRTYPFSPAELAGFGASAHATDFTRSGTTESAAFGLEDRPLVLLVDDNETNRIVGRALVEALGYEVHTAHDGLDAIERCRQTPPRLVLIDLDMPVLDGIDTTVHLRSLQRSGEIPPFSVVAATADTSAEAELKCTRAGMDAYLTKPLRLPELRAQLRRFTAGR